MGDIVHIDLPFKGDKFAKGASYGAVESVKTSAEVYSPIELEILENNLTLEDNPAIVNEEAEGKGWISKVKVLNPKDLHDLLDETGYKKFLAEEADH